MNLDPDSLKDASVTSADNIALEYAFQIIFVVFFASVSASSVSASLVFASHLPRSCDWCSCYCAASEVTLGARLRAVLSMQVDGRAACSVAVWPDALPG